MYVVYVWTGWWLISLVLVLVTIKGYYYYYYYYYYYIKLELKGSYDAISSFPFSLECYKLLYYRAVECLNLIGWWTFWGVQLFSGKCKANVVPGSSLDCITWPYHFAKWFLLFQWSCNRKITKTHNDTGQTNKYRKQKDKIDRSCPYFCHKIQFYYVRKMHRLLSLSRSLPHRRTVWTHLNISANVVSTTLMILSVT